jgi:hypothetical protein
MNRHRPIAPRAFAATRRTPVRSVATLVAVAFLLALTALMLARLLPSLAGATRVSSVVPGPGDRTVALNPSTDSGLQRWNLIAPLPDAAQDRHTRTPRTAPADPTNWDALRIGISSAQIAAAPGGEVAAPGPADLTVRLTPAERARLIAAAREPESLPSPEGYRPAIAVISSGNSDGICR